VKQQYTTLYTLLFLLLTTIGTTTAQVSVEGNVNTRGKNVLVGAYSKSAHQLVPVEDNGDFFCRLPRYEECVIVFYELNSIPKTVSINTDNSCTVPIKLNINLDGGERTNIDEVRLGPDARYVTNGSDYNRKEFNLDMVKDKTAYATLMSQVSRDLQGYYKENKLPVQRMGYSSNTKEADLMKTEHKLGQEIYQLLLKKRSLQAQLDKLNASYSSGAVSANQQCNIDITLLKKEASFAKTDADLAVKQLEKEKLIVKRKETVGKATTNNAVSNAAVKVKTLRRKYEIAALNMKNKQADCWERKLQNEIDSKIASGQSRNDKEIKLKQLDISDIRYKQRLDNAYELVKHHNQLANDFTDRDRVVELANAQKYISELQQIKLYKADNTLKRWKYKDDNTGRFAKQIGMAKKQYSNQQEVAFQAEMAYLEHIWHLRGKPEIEGGLEDLFNRQSDLLAVQLIPRNEAKEETLEEIPTAAAAPSSPTPAAVQSDEEILSSIEVTETSDDRGDVKEVKIQEDRYEIIVNRKGVKRYLKNGNAITRLTYQFETKRKFGEMLENITYEERKSKLLELLKKKVE